MIQIPVLIVGAGPSGLTMACELARRGIEFRIIDKLLHPIKTSNALGIQSRTLEIWQDMGIIKSALEQGHRIKAMNAYSDKNRIMHVEFKRLTSPFPFILGLPQHQTEAILTEHLSGFDLAVERGVNLTNFQQNKEYIDVNLTLADETEEQLRCQWLIASDGAHSFCRKRLNLEFKGKELAEHFIMCDAQLDWSLANDQAYVFLSQSGLMVCIPQKNFHRLIFEVSTQTKYAKAGTPKLEDFQKLAGQRCPFKLNITEPSWISGFWIHQRQVAHYRQQRVFLLGDAAHIHSPAGGQGMNTGIQDAYNLAWKLALVCQNRTTNKLLDSYHAERHPIGKAVLKHASMMTKVASLHNNGAIQLRNTLLKGLGHSNRFSQSLAEQVSELDINYNRSPISINANNNATATLKKLIGQGNALQAGQRCPDFAIQALDLPSKRFFTLLKGTHSKALLFTGPNINTEQLAKLKELAKLLNKRSLEDIKIILISSEVEPQPDHLWTHILLDAQLSIHKKFNTEKQSSLYVIRPDGYIGFRSIGLSGSQLQTYLQAVYLG